MGDVIVREGRRWLLADNGEPRAASRQTTIWIRPSDGALMFDGPWQDRPGDTSGPLLDELLRRHAERNGGGNG